MKEKIEDEFTAIPPSVARAMVQWWKRMIYSLVSVVVAVLVTCAFIDFWEFIANSKTHFDASGLLLFIYFALFFSLPGWLLAVPIVLIVTDIRAWRFWIYWAVGSAIGPVVILGIALYSFLISPTFAGFAPESIGFLYLSAAVSSLTTLIYLLLMKLTQWRMGFGFQIETLPKT